MSMSKENKNKGLATVTSKGIVLVPTVNENRNRKLVRYQEVNYDPYEIDPFFYELIVKTIEGIKNPRIAERIVNSLIPEKTHLYQSFLAFKPIYERIKQQERKQAIIDDLNKHLDDMVENTKLAISVFKRGERGKNSKSDGGVKKHKFAKYFQFLDINIEMIQGMIIICTPPKKMVEELSKFCSGLNITIFYYWKDETKFIEELQFAYRASADEHMYLAKEIMDSWLHKPNLQVQHTALAREIGLYHSRMADFLNRKKWGKQVVVSDGDNNVKKVLSGSDITHFLQGLQAVADAANGMGIPVASDEEEDIEGEVNGEFTEFEEINP